MDYEKLKAAVGDLDDAAVRAILGEVMSDDGTQAQSALDACREGLDVVGQRFEDKEYFVSDLIFAGELMTEAVEMLKSALAAGGRGGLGKLILCTVKNDLHDIGKNIVRSILEAAGFEVLDLGIDTPPAKIVEEAKDNNIKIIALSGVLTLAVESMKATVDAFEAAGMRASVKIIIGGCPVSEDARKYTGADAWAYNPQDTAKICHDWAVA